MRAARWALCLIAICAPLVGGVETGKAALRRGDYSAAYREFLPLAERGDGVAMVTIGLMFHEGRLGKPDYTEAMDWYVRAFDKENGDAFNNIAVMYRDGLGVTKNRRIAYALFLIVHLAGLGTESTQIRTNGNLRREVAELRPEDIAGALCYSDEYIMAYVHARGVPEKFRPSKNAVLLRDKDWWLPSEEQHLPKCK